MSAEAIVGFIFLSVVAVTIIFSIGYAVGAASKQKVYGKLYHALEFIEERKLDVSYGAKLHADGSKNAFQSAKSNAYYDSGRGYQGD